MLPPATPVRSTSMRARAICAVILVMLVALSPVAWTISERADGPRSRRVLATRAVLRRRRLSRPPPCGCAVLGRGPPSRRGTASSSVSAEYIVTPHHVDLGAGRQPFPVARTGDVDGGDRRRGLEGLLRSAAARQIDQETGGEGIARAHR